MEEKKKDADRKVLDNVKKKHAQFLEEIELFKVSLPYLDNEEAYNNVRKVINFFSENMVSHFNYEERKIFSIALVIGELEIKQIVRDLQQEHIFILSKFDKLKDIIFKHGFSFHDQELKKEFIGLSKEIIGLFLQHARKEDNKLYSYLENKGMNIKFKD
jgi:hemerythrin-like domain-containing protein